MSGTSHDPLTYLTLTTTIKGCHLYYLTSRDILSPGEISPLKVVDQAVAGSELRSGDVRCKAKGTRFHSDPKYWRKTELSVQAITTVESLASHPTLCGKLRKKKLATESVDLGFIKLKFKY